MTDGGGEAAEDVGLVLPPLPSDSVTGHTVVYRSMVSVVTCPSFAGQLVTVGAQDVMVYVLVSRTVEVVYCVLEEVVETPLLVEATDELFLYGGVMLGLDTTGLEVVVALDVGLLVGGDEGVVLSIVSIQSTEGALQTPTGEISWEMSWAR